MPGGTGDRFQKIADTLFNGNVSEFARNMQMTPGAFNKYMKGDTMPGGKILKRLISLDISPAWILAGIKPMRVSQIEGEKVTRIDFVEEEGVSGGFGSKRGMDQSDPGNDFFNHINDEDLSETERALLGEVKSFSDYLKTTSVPLRVKRLMLELMIQHIDQEIERLQNNQTE